MKLIAKIFSLLLVSFLIFSVYACGQSKKQKELTIDERYPKPWKEPNGQELLVISQTLIKKNVTGCGEYYLRKSSQDSGEYLIGCTSDGVNWSYYIIWPQIEDVMGPYTDESIEKPG